MIDESILNYISKCSTDEPELLKELTRETYLKAINPRMISGHIQGLLLSIISQAIAPKAILELGTYTGYSAICLAQGLAEQGVLHTIEKNDEIIRFPETYFKKANLIDKIKIHIGNALDIIPTFNIKFDLIFLDADKKNYSKYYDLCFDRLNPGGIILADNVLWNGKVLDPATYSEPDTIAIMEFNEKVKNDNRVETVMLPLRDGLTIIRKKD